MELITGNDVEHFTPTSEQLQPYKQFKCGQTDCNSTFNNLSNYELHLEKHHRISLGERVFNLRLYHCPEANCIYQFGRENSKHFKTMKYLRQHYQKVHMAKDFVCEDCGKAFSLDSQLRKHKRDVCGKAFACRECGWPYESLEALLTHGKRKGHNVKEVIMINKREGKVPIRARATKEVVVQVQEEKQPLVQAERVDTEGNKEPFMHHEINGNFQATQNACVNQMSAAVQTDCFSQMSDSATNQDQDISSALDEIHSLLRDIETQTEPFLATANENQNYLDQMLAQSSHMYTQTCDDFLSELCLADIQTQTHWPSPQRHNEDKLQFTSTATSTNPCIHDELLVSTETQTSFTQCLLNSSTNPCIHDELLVSTETQTMDPLLEGFDFGGQDSDLMDGGFQSTYTQT